MLPVNGRPGPFMSQSHDEEDYFDLNPPPDTLPIHRALVDSFIERHRTENRPVVLVTSGGTSVPLENQTVRSIENFSAGTRGATSAEHFLENGYAVIFFHRQFSLLPYSRHYSHSTNCFLDYMSEQPDGKVGLGEQYQRKMGEVLRKYNCAKDLKTLLLLPFTTITEYLWVLKTIAINMRPLGSSAMFYLAAAVSDFFVPKHRLAEHKIQSGDPSITWNEGNEKEIGTMKNQTGNKLIVDLDPVPKFLKNLVDRWAPHGIIVSFKLETDPSLLISKSRQALRRYSHHLVIGNLLSTRKWEVVFVAPDAEEKWIRIPTHQRVKSVTDHQYLPNGFDADVAVSRDSGREIVDPVEIESMIIPEVINLHKHHMKTSLTLSNEY